MALARRPAAAMVRSSSATSTVPGNPGDPLQLLRHGSEVNVAVFIPAGDVILTGSDDNAALLWDVARGEMLPPRLPHNGQVTTVAFSPDGRRAVTGSNDMVVRLWNIA